LNNDFDVNNIILASNYDEEIDVNLFTKVSNNLMAHGTGEYDLGENRPVKKAVKHNFARRNKSQGRNGGVFSRTRPSELTPGDGVGLGAELMLDRGERVLSEY
jgi:hypothetical protein